MSFRDDYKEDRFKEVGDTEEVKELKATIKRQKEAIDLIKNHTYVYDTFELFVDSGEFHMVYGDMNNPREIVINCQTLYNDLPFIIDQVVKENKKMQNNVLSRIKKVTKKL